MRVITRGLPLLIAATLLTATPVGAADQGDVGIVDGTVRVVAVATIPGESWGSDSDCIYEVVIEDDLAFGVYEVDGTRMYSDTGRWLRKSCEGETIILVLIPVQVGLWWHAKQAAETAAGEALDAAQVESATPAHGHAGATAVLSQAGNLENVTIAVDRSATTVTVTVSGELGFSLFPGAWGVTAHAEGEIERFVPVGER